MSACQRTPKSKLTKRGITNSLITFFALGLISSCAFSPGTEYTLYRTGLDLPSQTHDETLRIQVATFDARPLENNEDNIKYNLSNCEFAQELFNANQPHYRSGKIAAIKIKYWCEKGRFKK